MVNLRPLEREATTASCHHRRLDVGVSTPGAGRGHAGGNQGKRPHFHVHTSHFHSASIEASGGYLKAEVSGKTFPDFWRLLFAVESIQTNAYP